MIVMMNDTLHNPRDISGILASFLRSVARYRTRSRDRVLRSRPGSRNLPETDGEILEVVLGKDKGDVAFGALAEELEHRTEGTINKSTLSQALGRLEADGLVVRSYPKGPRHPIVSLTHSGRQIAVALRDVDSHVVPKILAFVDLSDDERIAVGRVLSKGLADFRSLEGGDVSPFDSIERANIARVYDYILGGQFFFRADAEAAELLKRDLPAASLGARANRAFLRRAVSFLAERGVAQFIDLGSGLPTTGNTHELALMHNTAARTLYVDRDEYVFRVMSLVQPENLGMCALRAEVKDAQKILDAAKSFGFDLSAPTALIFTAVLHFVTDFDEAKMAVRSLLSAFPGRAYLVVSHAHFTRDSLEIGSRVVDRYRQLVGDVTIRSEKDIRELFAGTKLLSEDTNASAGGRGLVFAPSWRPDIEDPFLFGDAPPLRDEPERSMLLAGVGEWNGGAH